MAKNSSIWTKKLKATKKALPVHRHSLDEFRRVEVMRRWAGELKLAREGNSAANEWALVGHAVLVLSKDVEECRDLFCLVAKEAGFHFLALTSKEVGNVVSAKSALLAIAPCLVYLEPGEWMRTVDTQKIDDNAEKMLAFQPHLRKVIADFDPQHPIVYASSVETLSDIDMEFRRAGIFDRRFERVEPTLMEKGEDFLRLLGSSVCGESMLIHPGKIGKLIDSNYDDSRQQGIIALALRRISSREKRKVEFIDLVNIATHGSGEIDVEPRDSEDMLRMVSVHEAGHATVAIIDSKGENIPDYSSAFPGRRFGGVVVESYGYGYSRDGRMSYVDFRHKIRIGLAGRAAEQMILGPEHITVRGASYDLKKATSLCREMFGDCGISPDIEDCPESSGSNLAVVMDQSSPSECARVEAITQKFLERQYQLVMKILMEHRSLFDIITNRLMTNRILDQGELAELCSSLQRECAEGISVRVARRVSDIR